MSKTPNATTIAAMREARQMPKIKVMDSLGAAQENAESAAKELRLANAALEKAQQRVADAQEAHENAQRTLVSEVTSIRNSTRVVSLDLR